MRARLAAALVAALAVFPVAVAASDSDDALRLAQRIASPGFGTKATVLLHALPKDLPAIPLPAATLLGSVSHEVSPSPIGSVFAMAVGRPYSLMYDTATRDATVKAYEDALRTAGWKKSDLSSRLPFPRGGFAMNFPQIDPWCSPGPSPIAVTIRTSNAEPSALDLSVIAGSHSPFGCSGGNDVYAVPGLPKSILPTLSAAGGIAIEQSGPVFNGSTTGARITSSLGLPAIFETFAAQLRAAGWSPLAATAAASMQSQTFTKTVDGTRFVALLGVYALDGTHYAALTDVSDVASPPR